MMNKCVGSCVDSAIQTTVPQHYIDLEHIPEGSSDLSPVWSSSESPCLSPVS